MENITQTYYNIKTKVYNNVATKIEIFMGVEDWI